MSEDYESITEQFFNRVDYTLDCHRDHVLENVETGTCNTLELQLCVDGMEVVVKKLQTDEQPVATVRIEREDPVLDAITTYRIAKRQLEVAVRITDKPSFPG